jgi:hypothetical protein
MLGKEMPYCPPKPRFKNSKASVMVSDMGGQEIRYSGDRTLVIVMLALLGSAALTPVAR